MARNKITVATGGQLPLTIWYGFILELDQLVAYAFGSRSIPAPTGRWNGKMRKPGHRRDDMIIRRKGALRKERSFQTEGVITGARYRRGRKGGTVVAQMPRTANFYQGTGMYDWEVVLSTPELGELLSALAASATGPYRKTIARDLRPHVDAIRTLLDSCNKHDPEVCDSQ